jgi:hypothetical protein
MGRSMHDTVYVQNKSLHQTLKNITPKETFTKVKPEIELQDIWVPSEFSCTQRVEVQARPFKEKGYIYGITVNLRRHSRSTSLVKDRLRQAETVRQYLLPLQHFRGRQTLFQLIQLLQLICLEIL